MRWQPSVLKSYFLLPTKKRCVQHHNLCRESASVARTLSHNYEPIILFAPLTTFWLWTRGRDEVSIIEKARLVGHPSRSPCWLFLSHGRSSNVREKPRGFCHRHKQRSIHRVLGWGTWPSRRDLQATPIPACMNPQHSPSYALSSNVNIRPASTGMESLPMKTIYNDLTLRQYRPMSLSTQWLETETPKYQQHQTRVCLSI